jgi:hypothetical protein
MEDHPPNRADGFERRAERLVPPIRLPHADPCEPAEASRVGPRSRSAPASTSSTASPDRDVDAGVRCASATATAAAPGSPSPAPGSAVAKTRALIFRPSVA